MEKNYIQNSGKAKGKICIGLDHGYGNIKTAHRVFTTGVESYDDEPIVSSNYVKYRDKYYVIGESHLVYQGNKTDSGDFYILTLAGLAEELKFRGLHEAEVVFAAGLPLAWVKSQAAGWRTVLKNIMLQEPFQVKIRLQEKQIKGRRRRCRKRICRMP
jgi:plasmid segregation protein ParM